MKTLIIYLIMFSCFCSVDAQKCRYMTNKVSGMDGSRLVITEAYTLSGNFNTGKLEVWATIMGDTSIVVAFVVNSTIPIDVFKGDSVKVLFTTNEMIYCMIIQNSKSTVDNSTKYTLMTVIDYNDLPRIEGGLVSEVMIPSKKGELKGSPNTKKQAAVFSNIIGCTKSYLTVSSLP